MCSKPNLHDLLAKMARALDRLAPEPDNHRSLSDDDAFLWAAERHSAIPVARVNALPLALLKGIDENRDRLLENTQRFADGLPANNALLWGARGSGKSSLVKAIHRTVNDKQSQRNLPPIALIEIHREDIPTLPRLLELCRTNPQRRCLIFCDDLSFDAADGLYKSLKTVLEGGIEGRPDNVLFYATSNRRHLMARDMIENEQGSAINPGEAVEEKVSLSDRFGLWLGFHHCDQDTYLRMVVAYADYYKLPVAKESLIQQALEWSIGRGSRSGRVAWQFIQDLAGALGRKLDQEP